MYTHPVAELPQSPKRNVKSGNIKILLIINQLFRYIVLGNNKII